MTYQKVKMENRLGCLHNQVMWPIKGQGLSVHQHDQECGSWTPMAWTQEPPWSLTAMLSYAISPWLLIQSLWSGSPLWLAMSMVSTGPDKYCRRCKKGEFGPLTDILLISPKGDQLCILSPGNEPDVVYTVPNYPQCNVGMLNLDIGCETWQHWNHGQLFQKVSPFCPFIISNSAHLS